jgi:hypothetical protein
MSWSTRLEKLGFTVEEMVRCRTNSGGVVFIPARIDDEPVQLMFSNGRTFDCFLYESYAQDRGLPVSVEGPNRFTEIGTLSAFGRTVTGTRALVGQEYRYGDPPIGGFLCMKFFHDGVVAIDASVPAMAFATTRDALSLGGCVSRLVFKGNFVTIGGQPFTIGYQQTSYVTPLYLGDKKPGPNGRADLTVSLPGGVTVTESVEVRASDMKIAGSLGADLFCRWITVFDFPAGELLLFPYD